ncbi:MAG: hypothetical protein IJ590_03985 [Rickettsiales bacterium]|nr:hypothetical protein [Rickettsiales bacterium]
MNSNVFKIVRTYNLGNGKKISIISDGNFYYTVNYHFQQLPSTLTVYDGELYNSNPWQKWPEDPFPSTMLWHGNLIDFDNYNQLWPSMGGTLAQIYRAWRNSNPVKIPNNAAKNQFKKAFILMGKNKINLNLLLDPNTCPQFLSFLDFAKYIINNTNDEQTCKNMYAILQSCCLSNEETQLQDFYHQKFQKLNQNNQGFYQNNNQLNQFNNQINNNNFQNNNLHTTTSTDPSFGTIEVKWKYNGSEAQIVGLNVHGSQIGNLQQLAEPGGLFAVAKDSNLICIKLQDNKLTIDDINGYNLATINLLEQQVNQNQNVGQNFNVNNNFNPGIQPEAFIQNNNINNNFNFNQQNWQQNFSQGENSVLNDIQQFYNSNLGDKYAIVCKRYYNDGNFQKWNEIDNFYKTHQNNLNALDRYYRKEYAKYWINKFNADAWKQLVSKCVPYDNRIGTFSRFLKDAGYECFASFLEKPLVNLDNQQKLNIIHATFDKNTLQPLPQYKKFFDNSCFIAFLACYAQQQNLLNNPNADYLANLFGGYKTNNLALERIRHNNLLQLQIPVNNNNGQSWNILAGNDKILAYYIGYILFSNDPQTQGFGRLFAIHTIFPWVRKYTQNGFYQTDWFPESKPPLVGGVEICEPKPVDDDVKECLEKLSKNGVNGLGGEYRVNTNNETTTIRKGNKLIFEGTLKQDGKGFTEGTLVVKYDNKGQPDEYYQGQFNGVKMDGKGTYVFAKQFPDKEKHAAYEGQFKDGQMNGKGTYCTADGFSAEITYNNGLPVNVKNAKDRSNTDVIVFDFFGFGSEAFEDLNHSGRYNSSFFITDNRSYQYKREKIFKLKNEEGMPGLYQQPNEGQQKAIDFIKTHLLIQGAKHYTKLLDEKELLKIPGFDLREAIKEFCGVTQLPKLSEQVKEKWLCFVIDKIGPDEFNKMYLQDNIDFHFGKIQQNTDKKLKIVLNIHGTPRLGMSFGPKTEGYKEKFKLINNIFQRAASLGRDMYVSNNSCYGSQFLEDDKQNIFEHIGVDIFANKADFKPIITNTGINESINDIKAKYKSTNNFLNICKLKAEADSWRLTKNYSMITHNTENLLSTKIESLKDFFINIFYKQFQFNKSLNLNSTNNDVIFHDISPQQKKITTVLRTNNVVGANKNISFLTAIEKISLSDRLTQPFEEHIYEFFDFVKKKLFEANDINQLTEEGREIEKAIKARKEMVKDLVVEKEEKNKENHKVKVIECGKEGVLKKIDEACQALKKTEKDKQQIESLKQAISETFKKNGKLEPKELIDMLSKVDLFYPNAGSLIKKLENEFVKEKMQGKLNANGMTLEQLDEFGKENVGKMLDHLSTSILLTKSFLLGGVLSKKMGVDKTLEGFRERCHRLLYKFGDQEHNAAVIDDLNIELDQEIGKIKNDIQSKCEEYVDYIKQNNWQGVQNELQKMKDEIFTTDNYYTQQLSKEKLKELQQQKFEFSKENFINFLNLLPEKIKQSMNKAKDNIKKYCQEIKNDNNKQSIKDLLKQLKKDKMQSNNIIYSTNMTGMTPSYIFERMDGAGKISNKNLGKMYYKVENNQIEPLVKNKEEYQEALRKFEMQLTNTEKRGAASNVPGLAGVKFHKFDDVEQIQSQNTELMKFVNEGKRVKNELMGWVEKEEKNVDEKFPEDTTREQPQDNIYAKQLNIISNYGPAYNKNQQNNIKNKKQNNNFYKVPTTNGKYPVDNYKVPTTNGKYPVDSNRLRLPDNGRPDYYNDIYNGNQL